MSSLPATTHVPLFYLFQPDSERIEAALRAGSAHPLSYEGVGGTETGIRPDWWFHARDIELGHGKDTFLRARAALDAWTQFDLPWVKLHNRGVPLREGEMVAFSSRQFGIWALNVCRIVYTLDESPPDGPHRYGFGYGTLESHAVQGEERFLVEWDPSDDSVRFEIAKFSRPCHPLVRVARPLTWWVQTRFTQDALQRMKGEMH